MNERYDRARKRQGGMIRSFLNSEQGKGWVEKHYQLEEGTVVLLSKGSETFSPDVLRQLLRYQDTHVLYPEGTNLNRSDCLDVALNFQANFGYLSSFARLRNAGYVVNHIRAGSALRSPLPFFRERGFGFHAMNIVEYLPEEGRSLHAAVDLTAHYNMDFERGENDIFLLLADSREELKSVLKRMTGSTWEEGDA